MYTYKLTLIEKVKVFLFGFCKYRNDNMQKHREDGPAVIWSDGTQYWYLNGNNVTDEVNEWFKEYNLTYETMDEEERMIFGFHIRSLMT